MDGSEQELQWTAVGAQFDGAADIADVFLLIIDAEFFVDRGNEVGNLNGVVFYKAAALV